jgi:3-mercaptopyruvate sulfurtransferase SseA
MVLALFSSRSPLSPRHLYNSIRAMSSAAPGYIQDDELAKHLKEQQRGEKKIAVVDVRDDDFEGGNIPGCVHVPSNVFLDKVNELVRSPLKDGEY